MRRRGYAHHPTRAESRRDAAEDARRAEAHAERENTNDAWTVAADAWEQAGDIERARFATLRSPKYGLDVISPDRADRIDKLLSGSKRTPRIESIHRHAALARAIDVYRFVRRPPRNVFAYYRDLVPGRRTTLGVIEANPPVVVFGTGGKLGVIRKTGTVRHAYNRATSPRIVSVTVLAINGYWYNGTCNLDTGTYCSLKRGKPWLKQYTPR